LAAISIPSSIEFFVTFFPIAAPARTEGPAPVTNGIHAAATSAAKAITSVFKLSIASCSSFEPSSATAYSTA
jgi:hypothetical protein